MLAAVASDLPDYQPGSDVELTGAGFAPGENVCLRITEDNPDFRFVISDSVTADENGAFVYSFRISPDFIAQYRVRSWGAVSGNYAETTFTDAPTVYNHYLDLGANWANTTITGNNTSYSEGEVVPHVFAVDVTSGTSYSISINYDYYNANSNACGFSRLAQYNLDRSPAPDGPAPSVDNAIGSGPGDFYTFGANITAVSAPYIDPGNAQQRIVDVTFTGTAARAYIYFGLELAVPNSVGTCGGARSWPGASLLTNVENGPTGSPIGGGAQLSINPSGVIPSISGVKWNDVDGDGVFDGGESTLSGWTIQLCTTAACAGGPVATDTTDALGRFNFKIAPVNNATFTYYVREVLQSGWVQTSPASGVYGPFTYAFNNKGETTTPSQVVNFGNRTASSISGTKFADSDFDGQFSAGDTKVGGITIQLCSNSGCTGGGNPIDTTVTSSTVGTLGEYSFTNLLPGTYYVREVLPPGGTEILPAGGFLGPIVLSASTPTTITGQDFLNLAPNPGLTLVKTATPATYDSAGDVISYSFELTNSGNVPLSGPFTVFDDKSSDESCPATASLAVGASITCTASYSITQSDMNAGSVTNTAYATGSYGGNAVTSNQDSETVTAVQTPALTLDKTASPATYSAVGNVISYSYLVTNSGNVSLSGPVTVVDDKATVVCPAVDTVGNLDGELDPGESVTCTASYTIDQDDLDDGSVTNTATASADGTNSNQDSETVTTVANAALTLVKTATPATYSAVDQVISYSYLVTNTGNVRRAGPVTVVDDKASVSCPDVTTVGNGDTWLNVGESITCTASYTITQADLDDGSVTNTATASAGGTDSNEDSETVTATQNASLALTKSADPLTYSVLNETITYTYIVSNNGNVTLDAPIAVSDDKASVSCTQPGDGQLSPLETATCTATYSITQADLNTGSVTNTATATASFDGNTVTSNQAQATVTATQSPALTIDKSTTTTTYAAPGDAIDYSYLVTNSGNVTLYDVSVVDDITTATCPDTSGGLAPGASITCLATYLVDQADIDFGSVTNVAYATDGETDSETDTVTVDATQSPALTIDKSTTTTTYAAPGDAIDYSYLVTNSGNVTLYDVSVVDDITTATCPDTSGGLAPGASITCLATYLVDQADIDFGSVTNVAYATDGETDSETDTVTVDATQSPALTIDKSTTTTTYAAPGDAIDYSYLVTNSGNVTLYDVSVVDDITTATCPDTSGGLAPGASITCLATYLVDQADIDFGSVTNVAYATDGETDSETDTVTVDATQSPALTIDKSTTTTTYAAPGDAIDYSYLVTNSGNVTLYDVSVVDDITTATCPDTSGGLAPGASITCLATYLVDQADIDFGSVTNVAYATDGETDSETDTVTVDATQSPALTIDKSTTTTTYAAPGDAIDYSYLVTNSGNVTLYDVSVVDDITTATCPDTSGGLAPGASITCLATYLVDQADIDFGSVTNVAYATDGETDSETDTVTVDATQSPALTIDKSTTTTTYAAPGDAIDYSYLVTNSGNVTLYDVSVVDDITTATCPDTSGGLAPGASITCLATYLVDQADIDFGSVTNVAYATDGETDSETDTVTVDATQSPALTIDKSTTTTTYAAPGDAIDYSYLVTNSGNVTLYDVSVTDAKAGVDCTIGTMVPGAVDTTTCTGSYTLTQADIDAGSVYNQAFATGTDPNDDPVDDDDENTQPIEQDPSIDIQKFSSLDLTVVDPADRADVGDEIDYSFTVTNTGNVTLTDVTVTDAKAGVDCTIGTMVPGAVDSTTCTGSYTLTQADIDAGSVYNQAFATGTDPNDDPVDDDDENTQPIEQDPSIDITKTFAADSVIAGGTGSSFNIVVTNDGNVTLHDALIEDDVDSRLTVTGVSGTKGVDANSDGDTQTVEWIIAMLAPGESATITVDFEVASDVEEANGTGGLNDADEYVSNTGTVSAEAPQGDADDPDDDITGTSTDTIDILVDIDLSIVKTFSPSEIDIPIPQGSNQVFTIEVSNAGPSDAVDVDVTDTVNGFLDISAVDSVEVTTGSGTCTWDMTPPPPLAASDIECSVDIPAGESVTITVTYTAAPFLDAVPDFGTQAGDEFRFMFVNGSILEGSTDGGPVYLDGEPADVTIITSLTRNDLIFDPPGSDPAFELHLSCSDPFTGGWGQSAGPVEGVDTNWQIAFFSIARWNGQRFLKSCGNVTTPFEIPNTATATGTDSFETQTVSDSDSVTIGPGITLDRLQTLGKRLTVRLTNLTGEEKEIVEVFAEWPNSNGNLTKVWLTQGTTSWTVWSGNAGSPSVTLGPGPGWSGATLLTGEGILRFDFKNKVAASGYTIRVLFGDGTFLDIHQ